MKLEEAAYIAGILDGEGAIGLSLKNRKIKNYFYHHLVPHIRVANTDMRLPSYLKCALGGFIITTDNGGGNRKELHTWSTEAWKVIIPLLKETLPFLRIKPEQAKVLLEYYEKRIDRRRLEGAIRDEKGKFRGHTKTQMPKENMSYYMKLKKLNHRGRRV